MHIVRPVLDGLYTVSGLAGACALLAICLLILAQILARQAGIHFPESDEMTAWSVAAATFLPQALIYRRGGHIRVLLLVERVTGAAFQRTADLFTLGIGLAAVLVLLVGTVDLARDSLVLGETSPGVLRLPLWIPQSLMAAGIGVFAIALIEDVIVTLGGGMASWRRLPVQDARERAGEEL